MKYFPPRILEPKCCFWVTLLRMEISGWGMKRTQLFSLEILASKLQTMQNEHQQRGRGGLKRVKTLNSLYSSYANPHVRSPRFKSPLLKYEHIQWYVSFDLVRGDSRHNYENSFQYVGNPQWIIIQLRIWLYVLQHMIVYNLNFLMSFQNSTNHLCKVWLLIAIEFEFRSGKK